MASPKAKTCQMCGATNMGVRNANLKLLDVLYVSLCPRCRAGINALNRDPKALAEMVAEANRPRRGPTDPPCEAGDNYKPVQRIERDFNGHRVVTHRCEKHQLKPGDPGTQNCTFTEE